MFENYSNDKGKKDCFAYRRGGYCEALDLMRCDGCTFYKTVEKHNEDIARLKRIQSTKEYRAAARRLQEQLAPKVNDDTLEYRGDGLKLRKLRYRMGLTQKEMAKALGLKSHNVYYMEHQERLTTRKRNYICEKLQLNNNYFEE